jgi:cytochrome b6-f complex iron-sulfur subunit
MPSVSDDRDLPLLTDPVGPARELPRIADGDPRSAAPPTPPAAAWVEPPRVSRRRLLARGAGAAAGLIAIGGSGAAAWKLLQETGDGALIRVPGTAADVVARIHAEGPMLLSPDVVLVDYPTDRLSAAAAVYDEATMIGLRLGLLALRPVSPHLACRVTFCRSSGWWEDVCGDTKFDRVGEVRSGPAAQGLDRWPVSAGIGSGRHFVLIDPRRRLVGVPIGTRTTNQQLGGPYCT